MSTDVPERAEAVNFRTITTGPSRRMVSFFIPGRHALPPPTPCKRPDSGVRMRSGSSDTGILPAKAVTRSSENRSRFTRYVGTNPERSLFLRQGARTEKPLKTDAAVRHVCDSRCPPSASDILKERLFRRHTGSGTSPTGRMRPIPATRKTGRRSNPEDRPGTRSFPKAGDRSRRLVGQNDSGPDDTVSRKLSNVSARTFRPATNESDRTSRDHGTRTLSDYCKET